MSDTEEKEQLALAMALSLENSIYRAPEEDREKDDLKMAVAASLGKKVEELTARDMLMADISSLPTPKRAREEDAFDSGFHHAMKRVDHSGTRYWDGIVKLTYVQGFIGPDYIQFKDIVQKHQLKKALVTAFVCSMDFINEHFPMDVNVCIVTHGRPAIRKQVHSHRIIIQPPLKDDRYGVFHPKLMLLFHATSLRVVIGSANLERYDYEELENVVFIQDFPKINTPHESIEALPTFAKDISDLLDQMQVPTSVKDELLHYDFSKAKAHIVASVSGVFEGEQEYKRYGHTRLASIVKEITGSIVDKPYFPKVELQTSSLGSMTVFYLQELYKSFCGIPPYPKERSIKLLEKNEIPPIDIIFPSQDTVESSKLGPPGAGTICLNTSTWRKSTFPKQIMCDSLSQRQGTLMHSKYIIATLPKAMPNRNGIKGWIYCGSHNATTSAWGKFVVTRDSKQPKMSISNWELGVVLPLTDNTDIPAPYLRPAPRYKPNQQAWTQDMDWS